MTLRIRIRTSEDIRTSKKVEVRFYILSQIYFETRAKTGKGIPCLKVSERREVVRDWGWNQRGQKACNWKSNQCGIQVD